jgi:hypothetical protein
MSFDNGLHNGNRYEAAAMVGVIGQRMTRSTRCIEMAIDWPLLTLPRQFQSP